MALFKPKLMIDKMIMLDAAFLRSKGIKTLLLDVDNTMTSDGNPVPGEGVESWLEEMKNEGMSIYIVSNNGEERVRPFASLLGLRFVSKALKPLPSGFRRAMKETGARARECAIIGDQIFTDMLGGNLAGGYTILCTPYYPEEGLSFRIRRRLERPLIRAYKRREH